MLISAALVSVTPGVSCPGAPFFVETASILPDIPIFYRTIY